MPDGISEEQPDELVQPEREAVRSSAAARARGAMRDDLFMQKKDGAQKENNVSAENEKRVNRPELVRKEEPEKDHQKQLEDRNIVLGAQRDQILAGVGDGRRAGVGHERTGLAAEHPLEYDFTACAAVVFIIGDHRLAGKLTGGQQLLRNARVLGGDEVDRAEDFACTGRKIAQIAAAGRERGISENLRQNRQFGLKNTCPLQSFHF